MFMIPWTLGKQYGTPSDLMPEELSVRLFDPILKTVLSLCIAGCVPAFAQFTVISTPTAAYTGATTLIPITVPDCTVLNSLSDGSQTVTFSMPVTVNTAGVFPENCSGWATWGSPPNTEGNSPRIVDTTVTSITLTVAAPSRTFGFEIEPQNSCPSVSPCPYNITATYYNGATQLGAVSRSIDGNAGALLEAASSGTPITSVVITAAAGSGGFGIAQFRYALPAPPTIPTMHPGALAGLGLLLAAAASLLARRQHAARGVRT